MPPAQLPAQTRAGARGAVLPHGCVAPDELGGAWPPDVPVQMRLSEGAALVLPPNGDLERRVLGFLARIG